MSRETVFAIFKKMSETTPENDLRENLRRISERIVAVARRAGRAPEDVKLIAVSKTYSTAIVQTAIAAGARRFGENRVQEAETKAAEIGDTTAEWHLIGNLQANKARKAVKTFDWIHTLDSLDIARRLERICAEEQRRELNVLIQVDLAGEATKSGAPEKDLPALVEFLTSCAHLKLRGLMVLPPFFDDAELARPYFRRLREIGAQLQAQNVFAESRAVEFSMGMSNDFEVAIEEGATFVRVGTAIFGNRQKTL